MIRKFAPLSKPGLEPAIEISNKLCDFILETTLKLGVQPNHVDVALISLGNIIKKTKAILELIRLGYENEAFILWRSLHEEECIFYVLAKYKEQAAEAYENHEEYMELNFDDYENNQLISDETKDKLPQDILRIKTKLQNEMSRYNVRKREFLDYGWLLSVDEFRKLYELGSLNLTFTGGLQKFAAQKETAKEFAYSSKYIHPTFHSQKNHKSRSLLELALMDTMVSLKNINRVFFDILDEVCLQEKTLYESISHEWKPIFKEYNMKFIDLTNRLSRILVGGNENEK